jgi:thiamine-monophosphate kinase
MTKLSEIGEFGLIARISKYFKQSLKPGITGIGDDCAIIPFNNKHALLITTDMLIEDQHFIRNRITPFELGYKSIAVNLSDIAAMGGTPEYVFLSTGIPQSIEIKWLDEFFRGIKELCDSSSTYLLGGDTTSSESKLIINIAVTGWAQLDKIKRRSTAKPGDVICVTDFVGDSGGGLKALLGNLPFNTDIKYLVKRHHMPVPGLREGQWLSDFPGVHAMIDVSDGVEALQRMSEKYNWNKYEIAVCGGEDYCLMLTVESHQYEYIKNNFTQRFNKPLYPVGKITTKKETLTFKLNGKKTDIIKHGFDHFKDK